jgi:hypothetical protein
MVILITIPVWAVPWPKAWLASPFGQLKHFGGVLVTHLGLVLWPCSLFLSRSFLQQRHSKERLQTAVLILFCVLLALGSTFHVLEFWRSLG